MNKNVIVISTSPRKGGNSEVLADEFMKGAKDAGNVVEKVTLYDKTLNFCKGCLTCQQNKDGHCFQKDDIDAIVNKMAKADVLVFATPIYFYEMCAQMKVLLDRTNPLFPIDTAFREIYFITSAAEEEQSAMDGAIKGMQGWIACFEKTTLCGVVYGNGVSDRQDIMKQNATLLKAYEMGRSI